MESLGFSEKWKSEVRNHWFCMFLKRNKLAVSSDRRVIRVNPQPTQNHRPQRAIPNLTPISPTTSNSSSNEPKHNKCKTSNEDSLTNNEIFNRVPKEYKCNMNDKIFDLYE